MQALGCAVALDDFGAGFGSFQYLKHLPFRYLKIDGDFIRGLPDSPHDQLVVKALVGVVRGMGKQTIAEFVGDEPTMALLRDYGVDYAQGFRVRPPCGPVEPLTRGSRPAFERKAARRLSRLWKLLAHRRVPRAIGEQPALERSSR